LNIHKNTRLALPPASLVHLWAFHSAFSFSGGAAPLISTTPKGHAESMVSSPRSFG